MAITGVLRPGHVAIRVLELEPALKHYKDVLGLTEVARDKKKRVFLKAWDEHDHHSVVLREADEAGMDYMGEEAAADDEWIDELFWTALTRPPTSAEQERLTALLAHAPDKRAALEDVLWALLNSKEFILRR